MMVPAAARPPRRGRWRLALIVFVLILGGLRILLSAPPVTRALAGPVAGWLAARTRATVQISSVHLGWNLAPCFEGLRTTRRRGPLRVKLSTPRACVRPWIPAWASAFHALRIELESPEIRIRADEREEVSAPSLPDRDAPNPKGWLREITLEFSSLRVQWEGLPFPAPLGNGTFGPLDGQVILQERAGLGAAVIDFEELSSGARIQGRVAPQDRSWDLAAGIEADVASILGELLDTEAVRLRRMPTRGRVGLRWRPDEERLRLDLDLEQFDVDFESVVTRDRLVGFDARERGLLQLDLRRRKLSVRDTSLELNGIVTELELDLVPRNGKPHLALRASLRLTPFGDLLRSIPGSTVPELAKTIPPSLRFGAELEISGPAEDPRRWTIRLDPRFEGLEADDSGLEYLKGPFSFHPLTNRGRAKRGIPVGPGTKNWVGYADIPYLLRRFIVVAEDGTFPFHQGVEPKELKEVLAEAFAGERRPRGGSTISQQLAKNLFLSRDRTALRKAQEALLALWLDAVLSKRELFEMYANLVEWGPGIYGIGPAAEHWFGRPPRELETQEMAYLATIIPAPSRFHSHHARGEAPPSHRLRVQALLEKLHRLDQLDDGVYAAARAAPILFAPEIPHPRRP